MGTFGGFSKVHLSFTLETFEQWQSLISDFRRMRGHPLCYSNKQCQNHCSLRVKFAKPGGPWPPVARMKLHQCLREPTQASLRSTIFALLQNRFINTLQRGDRSTRTSPSLLTRSSTRTIDNLHIHKATVNLTCSRQHSTNESCSFEV